MLQVEAQDEQDTFCIYLTKRKGKTACLHDEMLPFVSKRKCSIKHVKLLTIYLNHGADHTYNLELISIILGWLAGLCYFLICIYLFGLLLCFVGVCR